MMRFGYDIGGTNIAAGILDENNNLIAKGSVRFPRGCGNDAVIDACTELYRSIVAQAGIAPEDIVGVGVAVPGSVDPKNGIVIDAHNLGFHHTPLREMLSAKTEKPVYLINDADAATLAEHRIGALKGTSTAMLVTIGTGIGGGLILNGNCSAADAATERNPVIWFSATAEGTVPVGLTAVRKPTALQHVL